MAYRNHRPRHTAVPAAVKNDPAMARIPFAPKQRHSPAGDPMPSGWACAPLGCWKSHIRPTKSFHPNPRPMRSRRHRCRQRRKTRWFDRFKPAGTTNASAAKGFAVDQARPIIDAVAISSSSRASDTLPETEYGSSSGRSAYFKRMLVLILDMLTCPMVQPPNRRSNISS